MCRPMPRELAMSHMFCMTQPRLMIPRKSPSDAGARCRGSYRTTSSTELACNGTRDAALFLSSSVRSESRKSGFRMNGGNMVPRIPTFFLASSSSENDSWR